MRALYFIGFLSWMSLVTHSNILVYAEDVTIAATNIKGKVQIQRGDLTLDGTDGMLLQEKDKMTTDAAGQVDIVCNDRWAYRLLGSTTSSILSATQQASEIEIAAGDALFHVKPEEGSFKVSTPTAVAGVRGTKFWGRVSPGNALVPGIFGIREGTVEVFVKSIDFTVTLTEGQALDVPQGFQIPTVREANPAEMAAMKAIDEIPLFLLKASLADELEVLKQLEALPEKQKGDNAP